MASLNPILPPCSGSIHHQQYICWWSSRRIPLWQDAQGSATVTDCWLPPPDAPITMPGFCAVNQKAGYMSALAISFFNFVPISGHTARKLQKNHNHMTSTDFSFTIPEWKRTHPQNRIVAESLSAAKSQLSVVDRLLRLHASHLAIKTSAPALEKHEDVLWKLPTGKSSNSHQVHR